MLSHVYNNVGPSHLKPSLFSRQLSLIYASFQQLERVSVGHPSFNPRYAAHGDAIGGIRFYVSGLCTHRFRCICSRVCAFSDVVN
jgi:hypothetical protein